MGNANNLLMNSREDNEEKGTIFTKDFLMDDTKKNPYTELKSTISDAKQILINH